MESIILDFSKCKYIGEIHNIIRASFELPEWYGKNLSALWDSLDGYCDYDLMVYIYGFYLLPEELDEYKNKMWRVFCRVNENSPNIKFEILS